MSTRRARRNAMLLLAMVALTGSAHAATSNEGTSKGTVLRGYKAEYVDFEATVKNGPWTNANRDSIPTVAVIGIGTADEKSTRIVSAAVKAVPDLLSGTTGLKIAPAAEVKKYLKSKGVPDNPKDDSLRVVFRNALSRYDVVLLVRYSNGWLVVNAIHAISESKARHHHHSTYLPGSPSDQEIRDAVSLEQIAYSIDMALGKQKDEDKR